MLAALQRRPKDVVRVSVPAKSEAWAEVAKAAQKAGVQVSGEGGDGARDRDRGRRQGRPGDRDRSAPGRTGGAMALVRETEGVALESLFEGAESGGVWLALDCIQDPQNVGAIFRTAAFFGIRGIVLTQERSAPLTGTAFDVASGGMEWVPFTVQANLGHAMEVAKEAGLWILGTSEHAPGPLSEVDRDRAWLVVLGNEEKGIRRLTEERCDQLCSIPCAGKVTSLNVSVAAGILMAHFQSR
ncbi:MAG TPA: RNA methyltransferase [Bdellovibrionota bacterium]|nr:RNA methyltransferase [Bdellovibrionota bacterium]